MLRLCRDREFDLDNALSGLSIVRNLTMFAVSQPELLKHPSIIDDLLKMTEVERFSTKSTMAVANLVGKDEVRSELLREASSNALNNIVDILANCLEEDPSFRDGFALYEPLLSLRYLSIPKKNRDILGPSLVPLLPKVLKEAVQTQDVVSCGHVTAILSQFAFDKHTLVTIQAMEDVQKNLELIVSLSESSPSWRQAGHEAQGLLWTLSGAGDKDKTDFAVKTDQIMISYNWSHKHIAVKVHNFLVQSGFKVWRDDDQVSANLMESM